MPDICGWIALAGEAAPRPPVRGTERADFAVVGGGVTGLAAARRLAELAPGARILLVEGKRIAQGASARNSGFAVANESPGHAQLHRPGARAGYLAQNRIDRAGVAELHRLVELHGIDCLWEDTGSIHAAHDPAHFDALRHHAESFAGLGLDARLIEGEALAARLGTRHYGLGVESRGGALVQPARLVRGLFEALPAAVACREGSPVRAIERAGGGWRLATPAGTVEAGRVIVGLNAFLPRLGLGARRLLPVALSASLTRPLTAEEEARIGHPPGWGVLSPVSLGATMRLTADRRILMRNTAEYLPGGIPPRLLAARRRFHAQGLARRFPFLSEADIAFTWTGTICMSRNARPLFAETAPGLFASGGYNASGLARGTIMGRLIAEHALGRGSALLEDALARSGPGLLPPRPFLDLGARARLWHERRRARAET